MASQHSSETPELKVVVRDLRRRLGTLRDEMRLQLHLGGMEMKMTWKTLEPRVQEAEAFAKQASGASAEALSDVAQRLRSLIRELEGLRATQPHAQP